LNLESWILDLGSWILDLEDGIVMLFPNVGKELPLYAE